MKSLTSIFKFPLRIICNKEGHVLQRNEKSFGIFAPKSPWSCGVCGKEIKHGDFESMRKTGFIKN